MLGNTATSAGADEIVGELVLTGGNIVGHDVFSGMSDIGSTTARQVFETTVVLAGGVLAGKLADNGGPTRTIALNPDVSNPALGGAAPAEAPAKDQRGEPRDAAPDLGAFEARPVAGLVLLGRGLAERADRQRLGGPDLWPGRRRHPARPCRRRPAPRRLRGRPAAGGSGHDGLEGGQGHDTARGRAGE